MLFLASHAMRCIIISNEEPMTYVMEFSKVIFLSFHIGICYNNFTLIFCIVSHIEIRSLEINQRLKYVFCYMQAHYSPCVKLPFLGCKYNSTTSIRGRPKGARNKPIAEKIMNRRKQRSHLIQGASGAPNKLKKVLVITCEICK